MKRAFFILALWLGIVTLAFGQDIKSTTSQGYITASTVILRDGISGVDTTGTFHVTNYQSIKSGNATTKVNVNIQAKSTTASSTLVVRFVWLDNDLNPIYQSGLVTFTAASSVPLNGKYWAEYYPLNGLSASYITFHVITVSAGTWEVTMGGG